jgi:hypothetical protein
LTALLASGLLIGCSMVGVRSGYEAPAYEVVDALEDDLEIRRYGTRLAAQTTVQGEDPDEARGEAFRILAAYIFARNRGGGDIAMTVPVEVEDAGEEIAMTVPVETASAAGGVSMRFFMPGRFTRETLPPPADERVEIVEVPGETVAVLRFSGLGRSSSVAARQTQLLASLSDSGWEATGSSSALFYDPPWTLPFLRRNEVLVRVEARGSN